jgi:hypothetical protein
MPSSFIDSETEKPIEIQLRLTCSTFAELALALEKLANEIRLDPNGVFDFVRTEIFPSARSIN